MSESVSLILPTPPALNNLYFDNVITPRHGGRPFVRRVLSQAGTDYKQTVADIADGMTPIIGDVWIAFKWYRPRRIGDLDGIFKVILDGLTGYAYADDRQVAHIEADRFDDKLNPRVEIEIRPLGLC